MTLSQEVIEAIEKSLINNPQWSRQHVATVHGVSVSSVRKIADRLTKDRKIREKTNFQHIKGKMRGHTQFVVSKGAQFEERPPEKPTERQLAHRGKMSIDDVVHDREVRDADTSNDRYWDSLLA